MAKTKFVRVRPRTIDKLWKIRGDMGGQPFDKIIDRLINEKLDKIENNGKKKTIKGFPWQVK